MVVLPRGVESALGRALLAPLRHDARRVRLMPKRDLQHLLGCGNFEVQWQVDLGHEPVDIAVGDVSAILAEVSGNTVRTCLSCNMRRSNRIRMIAAARIPDRRDMVDIDAEAEPLGHAAARLPGLTAGMAASSAGTDSAS